MERGRETLVRVRPEGFPVISVSSPFLYVNVYIHIYIYIYV